MISGGAKFLKPSMCLSVDGATAVASNGSSTGQYCLDRNPFTYFYTVTSNDTITETLTIDFGSIKTFNRLFLIDHNLKNFNVKYKLAGVWTAFTGVIGLDGSLSGITETAFADDSSYYEFNQVSAQQIQISMTSTQIANQDKYLSQCVVTSEIGTFAGYPNITPIILDRNNKTQATLSGKVVSLKGDESVSFSFQFKNYPSAVAYNIDIDLVMTLQDLDTPFLVWVCGGRRGTKYFNYTLRGFRLRDLYLVAITKAIPVSYTQNVTKNSLNAELELSESI